LEFGLVIELGVGGAAVVVIFGKITALGFGQDVVWIWLAVFVGPGTADGFTGTVDGANFVVTVIWDDVGVASFTATIGFGVGGVGATL
jgi:hypothetical protein